MLFMHPCHLMFSALIHPPDSGRTDRVPRMVGPGTIRAAGSDRLICLVFGEACVCRVQRAADPADCRTRAVVLMVSKLLASEATQGLRRVWAQVEKPPVPEVDMGWGRTAKGD